MTDKPTTTDQTATIKAGYTFTQPALGLGVLMNQGNPLPDCTIAIPLAMLNRHGLVAGATGTGKTRTLQLLAEQLSANGVPVFAADIKGDLSGMITPGTSSEKLLARVEKIGQQWSPQGFPVEYFALGGQGNGIPLRATISAFGPVLLSKVMGLNETQESSLGLVFHYADTNGLPLLDLLDLRTLLQYLTSDEGKAELKGIGGLSTATAGVILRELVTLESQGAEAFFGEPEFDTRDLIRFDSQGRGVISLLELPNLTDRPALFSTFLMWLLADLFHDLPEVGDADKPKLVFFFDEAHLLFNNASKAFLESIQQTVRLIRSKGVGVFFVTQSPTDVDQTVLTQLASRVQHALRAHTPNDAKALKQTVQTYPKCDYDLADVLQNLGTGEAIVTVMNPDGAPTPVAWTRMFAPQAAMSPADPGVQTQQVTCSTLAPKYSQEINRESAQEMLAAKLEAGAKQAQLEADMKQQATQQKIERTQERAQHPKGEKSTLEKVVGSTVFKQVVRQTTTAILRGIFGTGRRR